MHVFITGGTGPIGSAVAAELIANDHTVLGLARSDASAAALKSAGAEPIRGDLADLSAIRQGCRAGRRRDPPGVRQRLLESRSPRQRDGGGGRGPRDARRGADRQRPPTGHMLGYAHRPRTSLHRGRPAPDRRAGRRPPAVP